MPSLIVMAGITMVTIVFMRTGWRLKRYEGLILVLLGVLRWITDFAFSGEA